MRHKGLRSTTGCHHDEDSLFAAQVLESAMSLPGVRSPATPEQAARLARRGCLPSVHERASIFLLLAEAITQLGKGPAAAEAKKVGLGVGTCRT